MIKYNSVSNHQNNFDFLRLVFASSVIISHSYPLSANEEFIGRWSNGQTDLGQFSVNVFFAISGYLIIQSLKRSQNIFDYLWKRILRLFPALIILLVLTMLILPFLYQGESNIFKEKSYWHYLLGGLSLYDVRFNVNGIFENNPYPKAINGSLWTLSYEFTMYVALMLLYYVKNQKLWLYLLIAAFMISYLAFLIRPTLLSHIFAIIKLGSENVYRLASYFILGAVLSLLNFSKINKIYVRFILLIILLISVPLHIFQYVQPFVLPILIIFIGVLETKYISSIGKKLGDISYGMYIYGFFVQQLLMYFFDFSLYTLMLLSLCLTFIPAYFSWHLIEKKALAYKKIIKWNKPLSQ